MNQTELAAALSATLRRGLPTQLQSRKGDGYVVRRFRLKPREDAALGLISQALALHVGRPVSLALAVRWMLNEAMAVSTATLSDPAKAAEARQKVTALAKAGTV